VAGIELKNVGKRFAHIDVIRDVSLFIADGEFCVLVGPSGSGKSTLLRVIAGLEEVTAGQLLIGGRDVTHEPPKGRDIAMVFQSYALYPQMTVRENMGFGLKLMKRSKEEIKRRVDEVAQMLSLTALLDRKPGALSGGQRQRVAMGRAMVREPAAFLFDEPLSNLDAALRSSVRQEIRSLHARLKTTSVYVTHDQVEAMTMGDKIVVLRDGRIEQAGSPTELYERPANRFVAGFIGSPAMNFCSLPAGLAPRLDATRLQLGVRPEHLQLGHCADAAAVFDCSVESVEFMGAQSQLALQSANGPLVISVADRPPFKAGDRISVSAPRERLHFFDSDSGLRQVIA
jgi:multiple sugar transport system ATP-binding protein